MKESKTFEELAAWLRSIAERGIFPVHAEEMLGLEAAARCIEEASSVGWHDAMKEKPPMGGAYLCAVLVPNQGGGFTVKQFVLRWDGYGWNCEDMIVIDWRELPPLPAGGVVLHG